MAKKKKFDSKNIKINEEDLSITKIGEMDTSSQSTVFIFFLFILIMVFVFFLPTIVNYINGESEKTDSYVEKSPEINENEADTEENEIKFYTISNILTISLEENIKLDQFSINENTLSFQVTNDSTNRFDFDKENYYLELYTEENTLLNRILLDNVIAHNSSDTVNLTLDETDVSLVKKLTFVKKEERDYPNITLTQNDLGESVLTCTKEEENITYKFNKEELFEINDVINIDNTKENYIALLNEWKTTSESLNAVEGITSILIDAKTSFVVNTLIDLKTAKLPNNASEYYYKKDTLAKVISFEMEARGFSCK